MNLSRLDTIITCEYKNCRIPVDLSKEGTFGVIIPAKAKTYITNVIPPIDSDIPKEVYDHALSEDIAYTFCMLHFALLNEHIDQEEKIHLRELDQCVHQSHLQQPGNLGFSV